jgi:5-deoxy-glucuronate isomerase
MPGATTMQYLHFGTISLSPNDAPVRFETGDHETGLLCLRGRAAVNIDGQQFTLDRYDALYVPREATIEVKASGEGCHLAEMSAPVSKRYPLQYVAFSEVQSDPTLHFKTGEPSAERHINIILGKNVQAGRLLAGVTFSAPGNWTSWPPHEHAIMLEEAYLYIDMPAPSFGVQFVYTDPAQPELAVVVREGDCVLMPKGYHPNVSAPGGSINFLWMMAAHREEVDRQFGVVNVQPEYAAAGTGLEASRSGE